MKNEIQLLKEWIEKERQDYEDHKHLYSDRLRLTMIDRQITLSEVLMQIENIEIYYQEESLNNLLDSIKDSATDDKILK